MPLSDADVGLVAPKGLSDADVGLESGPDPLRLALAEVMRGGISQEPNPLPTQPPLGAIAQFNLPRIPDVVPPPANVWQNTAQGAVDFGNNAIGLIEGMLTPEGAAAIPVAGAGGILGRTAVGAYFGIPMALEVPGQVAQVADSLAPNAPDGSTLDATGQLLQTLGFLGLLGAGHAKDFQNAMRPPQQWVGPLAPRGAQPELPVAPLQLRPPPYDWRKDPNVIDVPEPSQIPLQTPSTFDALVNPAPVKSVVKSEMPVNPPDYRLGREQAPVVLPEQLGQPIPGQKLLPQVAGPDGGGPRFGVDPSGKVVDLSQLSPMEKTELYRGPKVAQTRESVGVRPSQEPSPIIGEQPSATTITLYDAQGKPVELNVRSDNRTGPIEPVYRKSPLEEGGGKLPSHGEFTAGSQVTEGQGGTPSVGVARATDAFREQVQESTRLGKERDGTTRA
jgi:hypothetical protein